MGYESQFELFPDARSSGVSAGETHRQLKNLTVSSENIIVLFIIFVVSGVVAFSLGVERGKTAAIQDFVLRSSPAERGFPVKKAQEQKSESFELQAAAVTVVPLIAAQKSEKVETVQLAALSENFYTIQVASYAKEPQAQKAASSLKDSIGRETFVMNKGKHMIVCVGRFDQKKEAQQFTSKLKKKFNDCFVRRI